MVRNFIFAVLGLLFSITAAGATCSSYPYTLTNGTTADASQVMADFNCAVLTSGSNASGATFNSLTLTGPTTFQSTTTTQLLLNNTLGSHGNNIVFQQSGTNAWVMGQQAGDNSGNMNFYSYGSAAIVLSVNYTSNNVTCAGSCISASDERMKKNIRELTAQDGLSAIRQLKPVSFNWKKGDVGHEQVGFIAQQVRKVFPQLVANSGIRTPQTPNGMLAMNYGALSAPLVLSVQQLDAEVTKLRHANAQQAAEIHDLNLRNTNETVELRAEITALRRELHVQTAQR